MNSERGWSLIEVTMFIVIIGIVMTGILMSFNQVFSNSNNPGYLLKASQLAQARINIILVSRWVSGYTTLSDVCASGSPPAACTNLSTFASANGLSAGSSITNPSSTTKLATITVTGNGGTRNAVRFNQ